MRTNKLVLVLIANLLLFVGCDEQWDNSTITEWTWDDTAASFEEIEIVPGTTLDIVLETPNAPYEYAFTLIVPNEIDEVNGNPLVLNLHGGVGGAGRQAHKGTQCLKSSLEKINAFVLTPNADKIQWYELYNQEKILRILNLAGGNWPIDRSKLVVTGYSDGGNGTWFLAEFWPGVFSAGIAMATSYNTLKSNGDGREIETPLYVIHSSGDELFPLEETQNWVNKTIEAGSDVKFVIADGISHYAPCDVYKDYFDDAIQWLVEEVWQ